MRAGRRAMLAVIFAVLAPALSAEPPELVAQCLSCHGAAARLVLEDVPVIHGQQRAYLRSALRDYRDGARAHGQAAVMGGIVAPLSDAEIDALAYWFAAADPDAGVVVTTELQAIPGASAPHPATAAARLVYLDEDEGWARLLSAEAPRDFFLLGPLVESEALLTFCAAASIAAVLNSLPIDRPVDTPRYPYPFFTQSNVFTPANQAVRSFEAVATDGLTLDQIAAFLDNLGAAPELRRADATDVDAMRTFLRAALADPGRRVIVNYQRAALGQTGEGHVSPLGAYDAASDSVLILDVAPYKYPPVWAPVAVLHRAMAMVDPASGKARGVIAVALAP